MKTEAVRMVLPCIFVLMLAVIYGQKAGKDPFTLTPDAQSAITYTLRGAAKERKGNLNGAMADYNQAIQLDPKYFRAYNNRGLVRFREGDLDGAIAEYNQAISLNPKYGLAYRNRGNAKQKKGDLDGAIADFNLAIKLGVTDGD
jgi:tetratricopeptide (TPR) repeat protein